MNTSPVSYSHKLISFILLVSMVFGQFAVVSVTPAVAATPAVSSRPSSTKVQKEAAVEPSLFRTHVILRQPNDLSRIETMGAIVLDADEESAQLLVTSAQLEDLARLRFQPQTIDALDTLARSEEAPAWLNTSLQPVLAQANAQQRQVNTGLVEDEVATVEMVALLTTITAEQQAALAVVSSIDDDGDGLTNLEEAWWCTDPLNPNSDGDAAGFTDGQEVTALLDFTLPRSVRWGYGPPFGPPNAWPDWNGDDGDPETPACNDGDYDTIPDQAEVFVVGSRVPEESSDGDKFDDGQELFGVTYCPGVPINCGHGIYPRTDDWNYIQASMPNWVEPPGDNLFVAAFPVPEVFVVADSWTVERATIITTEEGEIVETTNSYETSVTRGQSTSIANTVSWNEWEEVSESVETPASSTRVPALERSPDGFWNRVWGGVQIAGGVALAGAVGATCLGATTVTVGAAAIACAAAAPAAAAVSGALVSAGWSDLTDPDEVQERNEYNITQITDVTASAEANASVTLNQNFDFQGVANGLEGMQNAINTQGDLLSQGLHDISYAISQPRFIETETKGTSYGGSQTTTHTTYEEHTVTQGQAFTNGQNWSTAWAVDSSHAADLTFNYTIKNTGTEYAREISGFIFNIYLGDDTEPLISYPAWEQFVGGKLENVFPGDTHTFASNSIPLTLEQMKRLDLGEKIKITIEDYSYGVDELFYNNAINGGVTVFLEDGVHDDDETVDMYVIPTWGTESVLDVLTRYFPHDVDSEGNVNSLWTPEFNGINPATWNEHFLSDIGWWNIYQTCQAANCADVGATALHEQTAVSGSAILFRFNRDSDRDGYQDRVEWKYGTDRDDPVSHPFPEVLAGYVATRQGNEVTVLLKMANSGSFDAYGIEAVMYAPDDTVTIGNNTVGGNGRIRPDSQIAVGSIIQQPDLSTWTNSSAQPYAIGNYEQGTDKTITFTVNVPGTVGVGGTSLDWTDGAGGSGTLGLGSNYYAPLPITVTEGIELGFDTGTLANGEGFSVNALAPRDTFTYTINSEPYTPPVIAVSYSDPQGSHRFITLVELTDLEEDLTTYSGQMLTDVGLQLVTRAPITATGVNTTSLTFVSPHPESIENAHLYLNFTADGALVAELPYTMTLQPGVTTLPASWSTAIFSQTYDANADNILIAFWTDGQNNIIDSTARPLNTFATDPLPAAEGSLADWNFGLVTQGQQLQHEVTLANLGYTLLYVSPSNAPGVATTLELLAPGDSQTLQIRLDTVDLPVGPYAETVTVRTNDPHNSAYTIQVSGVITELVGNVLVEPMENRPLDVSVWIPGSHNLWELITFTHSLELDPESLHPVNIYDESYTTLWGVGKYAPTSAITSTQTCGPFQEIQSIPTQGATDWESFTISNTHYLAIANLFDGSTFNIDSKIYRWTGQSFVEFQSIPTNGAYDWEFFTIGSDKFLVVANHSTAHGTYSINSEIYKWNGTNFDFFQSIPTIGATQWESFQIGSDFFLAVANNRVAANTHTVFSKIYKWNGSFFVEFQSIATNGATDWEAFVIDNIQYLAVANYTDDISHNINSMIYRWNGTNFVEFQSIATHGAGDWKHFTIDNVPYLAVANGFNDITENIDSKLYQWDGSYFVEVQSIPTSSAAEWDFITHGSEHFLAIANYQNDSGSEVFHWTGAQFDSVQNIPTLGGQDLDLLDIDQNIYLAVANHFDDDYLNVESKILKMEWCYLIEQVEISPYTATEVRLPNSFSDGNSYQIQYGRRLVFTDTQILTTHLRLPAADFNNVSLDALINGISTTNLITFSLDVGNTGNWDWQTTQLVTNSLTLQNSDLTDPFTQYWISQGMPASGYLDVPIRVGLSEPGQILLTNLIISQKEVVDLTPMINPVSATMETELITLTATITNSGSSPATAFTASFFATASGADDWYIGSVFVPGLAANNATQVEMDWDTSGFTGTVSVKMVVDAYDRVAELDEGNNEVTTTLIILTRADLQVSAITLSDPEPITGKTVTVTLTIYNAGQMDAPLSSFALYNGNPNDGGILLDEGAQTVPSESSTTLAFLWTPDALGSHRLFSVSDLDNAVDEFDEGNNQTWQDVYVGLSGPILLDSGVPTSDPAYSTTLGYGYVDTGTADALLNCGGSNPEDTLRRDPDGNVNYRFAHLQPGHFYHLDITLYECDGAGRQENILVDGNLLAGPEDLGDGEIHKLSLRLDPALYADRMIDVTIAAPGIDGAVVAAVNLHDVDYRYADAGGNADPEHGNNSDYGWLDGVDNAAWGTLPYQSVRVDQSDDQVSYQFDNLNPAKRYNVLLTFWQGSGSARIQKVRIDGSETGLTVDSGDFVRHDEKIAVPLGSYASDGSIVVSTIRLNASSGAMINEIALEEETLASAATCQVQTTPFFSQVYGNVALAGTSAPPETVVQAINPRGDIVGCFTVNNEGQYGFMRIYGEDSTANPPIPGMRAGEFVSFKVSGSPAVATPLLYWQDDKASHQVDLNAEPMEGQFILLSPGWNWLSLYVEPPTPLVAQTFSGNDYDRVLGETGIYDVNLPPVFNSLTEIHAGLGYMMRITNTASVNMLVEGVAMPPTTPIPLHQGWNWVGYLPTQTLPITVALQSITGQYQLVLGQYGTYDPALPDFSTLQEMGLGKGYMIYANTAVTLTYPAAAQANSTLYAPKTITTVPQTPLFTIAYGEVRLNGIPAPTGTIIEAVTADRYVAGRFVIQTAGVMGFMSVYGEDETAVSVISGFQPDEEISWRVNGHAVQSVSPLLWQNDWATHAIALDLFGYWGYLPFIQTGAGK